VAGFLETKYRSMIRGQNRLKELGDGPLHWEELIDFIEKNCGLIKPSCPTALYKCNLTQDELEEEYM